MFNDRFCRKRNSSLHTSQQPVPRDDVARLKLSIQKAQVHNRYPFSALPTTSGYVALPDKER